MLGHAYDYPHTNTLPRVKQSGSETLGQAYDYRKVQYEDKRGLVRWPKGPLDGASGKCLRNLLRLVMFMFDYFAPAANTIAFETVYLSVRCHNLLRYWFAPTANILPVCEAVFLLSIDCAFVRCHSSGHWQVEAMKN